MQNLKRMEIPLMFCDIGRIYLEDQVTLGVLNAACSQRKLKDLRAQLSLFCVCSTILASRCRNTSALACW